MKEAVHIPVMTAEVKEILSFEGPGWIVDATTGLGGHASMLLEVLPKAKLLGLDRDAQSLEIARERLAPYGERAKLVHANYAQLGSIMKELGIEEARSILLDLGLSSWQLSQADRGFSFGLEGPLDMRFDTSSGKTLEKILARISEEDLAQAIWQFGEERRSRAIARRIIADFKAGRLENTADLASSITAARGIRRRRASGSSRGPHHRREKIHPATQSFQALRILVNMELDALETFLGSARELLGVGGRIAVITFHSNEDRLVKRWFVHQAATCRCPRELPVCRCGGSPYMRLLSRGAKPSEEEVRINPRSRSAKLRAGQKLEIAD